ncbi:MAG: ethanolamine utilization microcompartment protein EutL [Deltaproteobacteria bacterium]|nr:ethanolamine utilization microcompartment protein EutL [Deltaproteobacteria bacterium]
MSDLVDLWPVLLTCRQIDAVDGQLAAALGLDPTKHTSAGLVTCDQDDSLYVALDECTKHARVDVVFGRSFYAGSKHGSGPLSGEVLGVVAGEHPDEVAEALWALKDALRRVRFQTFPGDATGVQGQPAFLAHVIAETGRYLAPQAGIAPGEPMAYLIAPPLESAVGVDAALKAAPVKLGKWIPPPSETNFGGAFLTGALPALEAARDAFVEAIRDVTRAPLAAARRPDRLRR